MSLTDAQKTRIMNAGSSVKCIAAYMKAVGGDVTPYDVAKFFYDEQSRQTEGVGAKAKMNVAFFRKRMQQMAQKQRVDRQHGMEIKAGEFKYQGNANEQVYRLKKKRARTP